MSFDIIHAGNPLLRQKARDLSLEEIRSTYVQELIEIMQGKLRAAPGVGLAAPQVGVPLRILVIEDRQAYFDKLSLEKAAERQRLPVPFHVLINPRLECHGAATVRFFEGCLSVPDFRAIVPRFPSVTLEALDHEGNQLPRITATGWYARILQHEVDHLQGGLYIDRMEPETFSTAKNYEENWSKAGTATPEALASLQLIGVGEEPYRTEAAPRPAILTPSRVAGARSYRDFIRNRIAARKPGASQAITETDLDAWLTEFEQGRNE